MAHLTLSPGKRGKIADTLPEDADAEAYYIRVTSAKVRIGHGKQRAANGALYRAGDRFRLSDMDGYDAWAYAPEDNNTKAEVDAHREGFAINLFPRTTVGTVTKDDGSEAAPATDDYVHRYGENVDINATTVEEVMEVPDRADTLTISVDDADGAGEVVVDFLTPDGNSVLTTRNASNRPAYDFDASSDAFVTVQAASPVVRVSFVDTSGARNTINYTAYAR